MRSSVRGSVASLVASLVVVAASGAMAWASRPGGERLAAGRPVARALPPPPTWAQGAVWYQVFPERFDNANPANDPRMPGVFTPGWNSDFYRVSPREVESAWAGAVAWGREGRLGHSPSALAQAIPFRRYGGDLQGVVRRLDHMKELGVTVIYFSPVFQAWSEHKYETSDHRHVDDSLGGPGPAPAIWRADPSETDDPATWKWTEADRYLLDVVLPEAHKRGLRVVLDGVWNHVGTSNWAFQDVLRHGRSSAYASWFRVRFDEDGGVRSWTGWQDRPNGDLPEFAQTPDGDLVPPVKAYVFNVTRRWMDPDADGDPSDGIDGWRLDVAPDIGIPFWRDWNAHVKLINPEAVTIGEIWMPATRWVEAGCFDAQMNYPLAMALVDWLRGARDAAWLSGRINGVFGPGDGLDGHDFCQMNLLGGHDTERIASMLENPGEAYDSGRGALRDRSYRGGRASPETYDRVELAYAILAVLPGSPMVFQGDEWGMVGGDDPECRKPVPWPDLGPLESADDEPLEEFAPRVARWLRLRSDPAVEDILRLGAMTLEESGDPDVLVIRRQSPAGTALLVANRGARAFDASALLARLGWSGTSPPVVAPRTALFQTLLKTDRP